MLALSSFTFEMRMCTASDLAIVFNEGLVFLSTWFSLEVPHGFISFTILALTIINDFNTTVSRCEINRDRITEHNNFHRII